MSLILPPSYRRKRSQTIDPERFRGYARHACGAEAFWFTRFGKAWFDLGASEVWFEDGQIKLKDKPVTDYRCPSCSERFREDGSDLKLVKIIQQDEAESMHKKEHKKVSVGKVCELCGERRV